MSGFVAEEKISDADIKTLSRLVGKDVRFFSSSAEIEPDHFVLDNLSVSFGVGKFICLHWDWYDTKICAIDVFKLQVEETDAPLGIDYENGARCGGVSVNAFLPNKLRAIHIFECIDEDEVIEG